MNNKTVDRGVLYFNKIIHQIELFKYFGICGIWYFQKKRNREARSNALWAIEEIVALIEKEMRGELNVLWSEEEYFDDVIYIIDTFILKMDRFLSIRRNNGFACARGTARRLKRYLLEDKL